MLYRPIGANKPRRIQGCFVSDDEVEKVVKFVRDNVGEASYDSHAIDAIDQHLVQIRYDQLKPVHHDQSCQTKKKPAAVF